MTDTAVDQTLCRLGYPSRVDRNDLWDNATRRPWRTQHGIALH